MPFGALSGVPEVITHKNFLCKSVKGFLGGSTPKSAISYTFSNDPYNSLCTVQTVMNDFHLR